MRQVFVALAPTLFGGLAAAPKLSNGDHQASAIDAFSLTKGARDLPEQNFPAH